MAAFIFGEKIDFLTIPNPESGGFVIGYDLDGILKEKDEFGVITVIGGGAGSLSQTLVNGNNTGQKPIILDNNSFIIDSFTKNKLNFSNGAISLTTDNEVYAQSFVYLTPTDAILGSGARSFRIEGGNIKAIYDVNNSQIISNNSYQLKISGNNVLEFSNTGITASTGNRPNVIISSDGSIIRSGIVNTAVIGGSSITATQSDSVYVPNLYIQDGKLIKGTNGNVIMSNEYNSIGIQSSSSAIALRTNGIVLKDTKIASTSPNFDTGITYISSKNSRNDANIINSVVIGGSNLNATSSNTVYLGNNVNINNAYKLPSVDGTSGQMIKTDGHGNLTWGSGTDGTSVTTDFIAFKSDYLNKILTKSSTYRILGADRDLYGGTEIFLSVDAYGNVIEESMYGKFYTPIYNKNLAGFGIWTPSNLYALNSKTIWGGYLWNNITGETGTSVDIFNLDSNWVLLTDYGYYNTSYDTIKYDILNDRIYYRNDGSNVVSTSTQNINYWINDMGLYNPIKVFQWGNIYNDVNGIGNNNIINSYNENINYRGLYQLNLSFSNLSYQDNVNFDTGSYQSNITLNNSSSQTNITFTNGSYQSNFEFNNSSYQDNIIFDNLSSQTNFLFDNSSIQTNLVEVNGYAQDSINLNSYKSNRTLSSLSENESYTIIGNDLSIEGNLRVYGTTSVISSENLTVKDPLVLLAGSQSGVPTLDAGIIVNRGDQSNVAMLWDEFNDEFSFISTDDDSTIVGSVDILDYSNVKAASFIVNGGSSSQFLKADGSVDEYLLETPIPVTLNTGHSFGKYVNGMTIPAGSNVFELIRDAVDEYINPAFNSFSISGQPTTVEVGTTLSGSKTFNWSITQNSGIITTLDIYDNTSSSNLLLNTSNDGTENLAITSIQLNANGSVQSWKGVAHNTRPNGVLNSSNFSVTSRFIYGYAPVTDYPANPSDGAANRTYLQALTTAYKTGNTFTLVTGTVRTKFIVMLPPGVTITDVYDSTNNATIRDSYILSTVSVNDAGGTTRIYNKYEYTISIPYPTSANHQITTT